MVFLKLLKVILLHECNMLIYGNSTNKELKKALVSILIGTLLFMIVGFLIYNASYGVFSKLAVIHNPDYYITSLQLILFIIALFILLAGIISSYKTMLFSPHVEFLLTKPISFSSIYLSEILGKVLIATILLTILIFPVLYSYDLLFQIPLLSYFAVYFIMAVFMSLILFIRIILSATIFKIAKKALFSKLIRAMFFIIYLILIFFAGLAALKAPPLSPTSLINNLIEIKPVKLLLTPFNLIAKSIFYALNQQFTDCLLNLIPVILLNFSMGILSFIFIRKIILFDDFIFEAYIQPARRKSTTFDLPYLSLNILKKDITLVRRQLRSVFSYIFIPLLIIIVTIVTIRSKSLEILEISREYALIISTIVGLMVADVILNSTIAEFSIDSEGKMVSLFKVAPINFKSIFVGKSLFGLASSLPFSILSFAITTSFFSLDINETLIGLYSIVVGSGIISCIWISSTFCFPKFDWKDRLSQVPSKKASWMGNFVSSIYIIAIGFTIILFVKFHVNIFLIALLMTAMSLIAFLIMMNISLKKIKEIEVT